MLVDGVASPEGEIRIRNEDEPVTLGLIGDSRGAPEVLSRLSERMINHTPDVVLHSGDFVMDARKPQEWDPQFFHPANRLLRSVPVYPAIGNHEHDHVSYYDAFEVPDNGSSRPEAW